MSVVPIVAVLFYALWNMFRSSNCRNANSVQNFGKIIETLCSRGCVCTDVSGEGIIRLYDVTFRYWSSTNCMQDLVLYYECRQQKWDRKWSSDVRNTSVYRMSHLQSKCYLICTFMENCQLRRGADTCVKVHEWGTRRNKEKFCE